jgi:hypothetical protein
MVVGFSPMSHPAVYAVSEYIEVVTKTKDISCKWRPPLVAYSSARPYSVSEDIMPTTHTSSQP